MRLRKLLFASIFSPLFFAMPAFALPADCSPTGSFSGCPESSIVVTDASVSLVSGIPDGSTSYLVYVATSTSGHFPLDHYRYLISDTNAEFDARFTDIDGSTWGEAGKTLNNECNAAVCDVAVLFVDGPGNVYGAFFLQYTEGTGAIIPLYFSIPESGLPSLEWISPADLSVSASTTVEMSIRYYNPEGYPGGPGFFDSIRIRSEGGIIGEYASSSNFSIGTTTSWTTISFSFEGIASTTYSFFAALSANGSYDSEIPLRISILAPSNGYEDMFGYAATSTPADYALDSCNLAVCSVSDPTGCFKKALCWAFVPSGDSLDLIKSLTWRESILGYFPYLLDQFRTMWTNTEMLPDMVFEIDGKTITMLRWADAKAATASIEVMLHDYVRDIMVFLCIIMILLDLQHLLGMRPHIPQAVIVRTEFVKGHKSTFAFGPGKKKQ